MTECQEVGEPLHAMTFTALRLAFADLGIRPHAMACHPGVDESLFAQVFLVPGGAG
jgi:hypothetical protein